MSSWSWTLILGIAAGWVALTILLNLPPRRLRRLAQSRTGTDSFARTREALPEIREDYLLKLYRSVQNLVPFRHFPLLPDDHLWDLGIDEGSLADFLETLVPGDDRPGTFADLAKAAWQNHRD